MNSQVFHKNLEKQLRSLGRTMIRDRHPLRRELKKLQRAKTPGEKEEKTLSRLSHKIKASTEERRQRHAKRPQLNYNPDLPVTARREEIVETIRKNQVVIISGETGSGKTTQIPKFCVEAGRGSGGLIAVTQPRRIAAVSVATRLAEEMGQELGGSVGYKIRFQEKGDKDGTIRLMTDGILLAEAQGDPFLSQYDTIIVDEAHERSLNIDFILGILRTLIRRRKDLKVIVTSATIDTEKFSKAFDGAPIIEVSGRTYPVEVIHRPLKTKEDSFVDEAVKAMDDIIAMGPHGDVLVFMPTEADIRETCDMIEGRRHRGLEVLPLYARLSAADQKKVFLSSPMRRVIVSTNVAETSITIPGIKYVIDTGVARIPSYSPRTRTTSLPVMEISRSSADQRKGRCGRVENGVCIRLYDEASYMGRPLFTLPEILRANLAEVILRMLSLKLGRVESFPFVDPPSSQSIADGFSTLVELGAIEEKRGRDGKPQWHLTETGRIMAAIPVDPKLARILIEAVKQCCLEEVLVIISALTIRDPRERPEGKEAQADQKHAAFKDPLSDFVTLLNVWKRFKEHMGKSKRTGLMKSFCKENYISFLRMREWMDIHQQLSRMMAEFDLSSMGIHTQVNTPAKRNKKAAFGQEYTAIHKAILSGYLSSIAMQKEKNLYNATKGREVMIFPGSGLFNKGGSWIVASEMVETSRLFARNVAKIDSDWLEELGKGLLKRTHFNPRWEKKMGAVVADEQVTLFGLIIVSERKVLFGPMDPDEATKIFIRKALVEADVEIPPKSREFEFLFYNRELIEEIQGMEDRIRRRDILISEEDLFAFYAEKLQHVWDIRTLAKQLKSSGGDHLRMNEEDLKRYHPQENELEAFPTDISVGGNQFSLSYAFEPGKEKDGVTLTVPAHSAKAMAREALDWVVPGLMAEKIEAMLKALPKEHRKRLVPVSNTAATVMEEMEELGALREGRFPERPLITALGSFIARRFGVRIPPNAWNANAVADHLKVRISVTGSKGKELAVSRDKSVLLTAHDHEEKPAKDEFLSLKKDWEKRDIKSWPMEHIPQEISEKGTRGFSALIDDKGTVHLTLFRHESDARRAHPKGVAALCRLLLSKEVRKLAQDLKLTGDAKKRAAYFGGDVQVGQTLCTRATELLFPAPCRTRESFDAHLKMVSGKLYQTGRSLLSATETILARYHDTSGLIYAEELKRAKTPAGQLLTAMLRNELDLLVPKNFIELYGPERLTHLERYIRAIALRATRAFDAPEKDRAKAKDVAPFVKSMNTLVASLSPDSSDEKREAIEALFWSIEEYKISIFAQEIGTQEKVSAKRLKKRIQAIEVMV